jgi:hypothetical protein
MAEDEQDKPKSRPMTRREFAIGSMSLLSAYALAEDTQVPPLSPEAQALKLEKSQDVQDLLVARQILDEDLKRVIEHAERTADKLYQPGTKLFLSKLRVKEAYFYVEYEPVGPAYRVHTAYSHRFVLGEEE